MKQSILAFSTGLIVCIIIMSLALPLLKKLKAKQEILSYVKEHSHKKGTPTMGGIAFIFAIFLCSLIFIKGDNKLAITSLAITIGYGIVGFLDDFIKIFFKRNKGLRAYQKLIIQLALAIIVGVYAYISPLIKGELIIPFSNVIVNLGIWIIPLVIVIFLSVTNGVNLTDGIDGLASGVTTTYLISICAIIALKATQLSNSGEMVLANEYYNVILLIVISIGALIGFSLFNCFPAKVFMGDTGSLALGGLVAGVSVFTKFSLLIPLIGIMFVVSCLSVIIQVVYFKFTKKRVFLMAPFHHHLQEKGNSETRIVVIYCMVTIFMAGVVIFSF